MTTTPKPTTILPTLDVFIRKHINDKSRRIHYYYDKHISSIREEYNRRINTLSEEIRSLRERLAAQSDPQSIPQPATQPVPQYVPQLVPQSVPQPVPQPVPQYVPQPVPRSQTTSKPVERSATKPIVVAGHDPEVLKWMFSGPGTAPVPMPKSIMTNPVYASNTVLLSYAKASNSVPASISAPNTHTTSEVSTQSSVPVAKIEPKATELSEDDVKRLEDAECESSSPPKPKGAKSAPYHRPTKKKYHKKIQEEKVLTFPLVALGWFFILCVTLFTS
jgi:hypothetical protein